MLEPMVALLLMAVRRMGLPRGLRLRLMRGLRLMLLPRGLMLLPRGGDRGPR